MVARPKLGTLFPTSRATVADPGPRVALSRVERQQRVDDVAHVPLAPRLALLLYEGLLGVVEVLLPHVAGELHVVRVAALARRPPPPSSGPPAPSRPARRRWRPLPPIPEHAFPEPAEPARPLAHTPSTASLPTAS